MLQRRLAWSAVAVLALLIVAGSLLDPVGFFALYGSPSGLLPVATRFQLAPALVYVPLLLAGSWWAVRTFAALRPRRLFAATWGGVVLAALIAKFAASVVATTPWLTAPALAWATGYTVPKAALYGLPVAGVVALLRLRAGTAEPATTGGTGHWTAAVAVTLFTAATGPWLAVHWWTISPSALLYGSWLPAPSPAANPPALATGLGLLLLATAGAQRWIGRHLSGPGALFLGGWLAALCAGALLAVVQTACALLSGSAADRPGGDLWPLAALWPRLSDGVSFGFAVGWVAGLAVLWARRRAADPLPYPPRTVRVVAGAVAAGLLAYIVVAPIGRARPASAEPAAATATGGLPLLGTVRGSSARIVDATGRQVLLRGVNVNQLVDFYQARPGVPVVRPLTDADFAGMARLGFNVVRLGVSWSALEPRPGSYDQTYLRAIDQAVAQAAAHRLYTVLDMHQDGWSAAPTPPGTACPPGTGRMWGYDGAPAWATITDGAARCQFTGRDISPAGDRAFSNFYTDRDGVQTRLVKAWAMLAGRLGTDPAVAGFDLLNEPGFGENAPITSTLLLGRFYDRAVHAIRSAERRRHFIFAEPSIFWSGLGFDAVPTGSFMKDPDIVFAPHLYAQSITMDASLGLPAIVGIDRGFALAERAAAAYGVPLWSGEWGYWSDVRSRTARFTAAEDRYRIGSAFWVWKQACGDPQNGDSTTGGGLNPVSCATGNDLPPNADTVRELSRAYPRAVPGRLTSLSADAATLRLTGRAAPGSCTLDVWVPGAARPTLSATRVSGLTATRTDGGWTVTGCATGTYTLRTG